jgi:hypothetical protein
MKPYTQIGNLKDKHQGTEFEELYGTFEKLQTSFIVEPLKPPQVKVLVLIAYFFYCMVFPYFCNFSPKQASFRRRKTPANIGE